MMKESSFSMKKCARQLVGFILMITGLNVYAGNLTASVDRDTLGLEETFTLVLRYDEQINATPDYELLQKDFDILNTQSGTQMSIINGNMEASTEWKIALAPKRIGTLLIPSFTIDGAISDAIPITVEGKSRTPKNNDSQVNVEIETSKDSAYVQEQIIVTLRLYTTVGLSGIDLQPLQVKDALVMQLDEKQYQTKINGRPGAVVETRYAIFPQQSGELIIPGVLYQVSLDSGQRDLWDRFYGNSQSNILRLRTEEQRLTINPAPAAYSQNWLPATKVELVEHWSASIDSLKVGEPITRTITIKADGLTAGQIAPLQLPNVDGLTFYSDQAQTDDQKNAQGMIGSRIETIAIVPTKAGRFTLPETTVSWWDTNKQTQQTATLPAITLNVGSGAMSPNNMAPPVDTQTEDEQTNSIPLNTDLSSIAAESSVVATKTPVWLYASNLITLLAALFFAWRFWTAKRELTQRQDNKQHLLTREHESEAAAWADVKRALGDKNLALLRKAILSWSQIYWNDKTLTSLHGVAQRAKTQPLTEVLQQLDSAIFSNTASTLDSENLLQLLANLRRRKYKKTAAGEPLQPLYKR
ncbi:BatD family protein [Cellvibrio sp. QJXJ]|uniref:BatD family protein n=1 Tax=Cellvibrio sp. QJXJ TaxID=2964606 RepID=UPI0021C36E2D|nr:BatD family protein [Cellvibrio sp. QJXJ]UUA73217.1 BatD family protein [Cellvibrio sp. QJXJ]